MTAPRAKVAPPTDTDQVKLPSNLRATAASWKQVATVTVTASPAKTREVKKATKPVKKAEVTLKTTPEVAAFPLVEAMDDNQDVPLVDTHSNTSKASQEPLNEGNEQPSASEACVSNVGSHKPAMASPVQPFASPLKSKTFTTRLPIGKATSLVLFGISSGSATQHKILRRMSS